jgi:catechol 2,3-dioxygenase-like lactoylglutathione lyase family enzyme
MSIEIIGIDHIYIAVSDLGRSEEFYDRVMTTLGFRKNTFTNEGDRHIQYYNRHFGFVLRPAHFAAIDAIYKEFAATGIDCSPPQLYPEYACDYYALFFSDPDGIRLEITNYREERRKRFSDWGHA